MKAIMRARLVGGAIDNDQMTISVINLGDKRNSAKEQSVAVSPTPLYVNSDIAINKMSEMMQLITKKMRLSLS